PYTHLSLSFQRLTDCRDLHSFPTRRSSDLISEDLWGPWVRFNLAILLCFWPQIFTVQLRGPTGAGLLAASILFGLYFFPAVLLRSEEHTSELQSRGHLVCRLLLDKKKTGLN